MTAIPAITVHTDDPHFVLCLPCILQLEGGNDDDKHDPGGRTSRGVTQREYNAYRRNKSLPARDVWLAEWPEIFDIYYISYWQPWCGKMWPGLNLMFFDETVNQGPTQAVRNVQKAINAFHDPGKMAALLRTVRLRSGIVKVDGHMGLITISMLNHVQGQKQFLEELYKVNLSFYRSLKLWWRYGKGWNSRAKIVYATARQLVS